MVRLQVDGSPFFVDIRENSNTQLDFFNLVIVVTAPQLLCLYCTRCSPSRSHFWLAALADVVKEQRAFSCISSLLARISFRVYAKLEKCFISTHLTRTAKALIKNVPWLLMTQQKRKKTDMISYPNDNNVWPK